MSTVIKDLGAVSAYAYAVEKGYTGTEAEFAELMADYADVGQRAEDAAESALNSKTAAQTAAQTATSKAAEASTSATNASGSASAASASASQASGSATSAANSATAASGSATSAAGSATTASTKASEAAQSEANTVIAKNAAEAAQTAAEAAQGKAEDAKGEAETTAQSIAASAAQIATNTADITQLKSEVSALPTDGVVANSKQLLSENGTDNTEPYMFRAVPVNADRAELDAVVGGTVNFNQIVPSADKDYTNSQTDTRAFYLIVSEAASPYTAMLMDSSVTTGKYNKILTASFSGGIRVVHSGSARNLNIIPNGDVSVVNGHKYLLSIDFVGIDTSTVGGVIANNMMIIDLTAFFGSSAIADYLYTLESGTAGAGVAWFKKLFPKDYYPYDAGTMKHVEGLSSHDTVGFNQWDEEWKIGELDVNTGAEISGNLLISKNYIPVLGGVSYYWKSPYGGIRCFYDGDKNFISTAYPTANTAFTTPSNARYMKFREPSNYGTTYKNDICINLSDPVKNGTYKPYVKHSYPLDSTLTLRGIPKLADGKLSYDGDRYLPDGTVERRYGIRAHQSGDESLADAITDGTNTVYKLTTPTTETADSYQSLQICDPNGTEEFVTTGIVPVGHETRYPENLRAKIEGLPWDFSSLIAPTEKTTTASRNYTTGSLLIMNNVLYKVTANIANGGTITVGTNVTATTLSEVISALQ